MANTPVGAPKLLSRFNDDELLTEIHRRELTALPAIAHIVHPADKIHELIDGNKTRVKALCGAMVNSAGSRNAPLCRNCFNVYDKLDLVGGVAGEKQSANAGNP